MSATNPHQPDRGRSAHPSNGSDAVYEVSEAAAEVAETAHRCERHWFEHAIARCDDCMTDMCPTCMVSVEGYATFCGGCSLSRSGLRSPSKRRSRRT